MMETDPGLRSLRKKIVWTLVLMVATVALMVVLLLPSYTRTADRNPLTIYRNNVRQLILACQSYAGDHDGAFPPELRVLVPGYISREEGESLLLYGNLGSDRAAFTYVPAMTAVETTAPQLVFISGVPMEYRDDFYVIAGRADGQVEIWQLKGEPEGPSVKIGE